MRAAEQSTNFGFLAVRVAASLSVHFGAGQLTNQDGVQSEAKLFGKPARWMDYSGPTAVRKDGESKESIEGVTYFDHPSNPDHPARWHVREDGWMGASACRSGPRTTTRTKPLLLRYLLHSHSGPLDNQKATRIAEKFQERPLLLVRRSTGKHRRYEIKRSVE